MEQDLEDVIFAGGNNEDIEAAILINILREPDGQVPPHQFDLEDVANEDCLTATCLLLRRLTYPNRLRGLNLFFGYSPQAMSIIINRVTDILIHNHGHLLSDLEQLPWLTERRFDLYAQVSILSGNAQFS
ncbi:hypothetical protein FQA39_LY10332 [Lamprigera yunnana]|nr:hypothetical protein FQA39_LY10332 [Lamprigera yunnana]